MRDVKKRGSAALGNVRIRLSMSACEQSRGPGGSQSDLDFMTEISIDLGGIDPERHPAFHLEQLRGSIVVPLDGHSIFHGFPFRSGDADAELRRFPPQAGKKFASDSVENLLGTP
jgi:hypothetical protein